MEAMTYCQSCRMPLDSVEILGDKNKTIARVKNIAFTATKMAHF